MHWRSALTFASLSIHFSMQCWSVITIPRLAAKPIVAKPVFELITQRAETDVFRRFDKIVLTRTQKKQCIVHRQKILFIPLEPKKISAHGSYVITMGWILRVWGPKRSQVLWSMTEGVLNDRNNIFMPIYYALFFLGTSNTTQPWYFLGNSYGTLKWRTISNAH